MLEISAILVVQVHMPVSAYSEPLPIYGIICSPSIGMNNTAWVYVLCYQISEALVVARVKNEYLNPSCGFTNHAKHPDLSMVDIYVGWKRVSKPSVIHVRPHGLIYLNMFTI